MGMSRHGRGIGGSGHDFYTLTYDEEEYEEDSLPGLGSNSPSSETGGYFNKLPPGILPHGMPEVKSIKPAVTKEEEKMNKQVWPPTHFSSDTFVCNKRFIDLPGGKICYPSSRKYYSLPFLPATPSSLSRTLEGLFELTGRPSRAHDSPHALLLELQRYKGTVRCVVLSAKQS